MVFTIKTITKREMELLLEKKILFNTRNGIVDKDGNPSGYYITKNKTRYIEEKYADIAKKLAIV